LPKNIAFLLLLCLAIGPLAPSFAAAANISITGKPAEFNPGESFDIFVRVDDVTDLAFYGVDLSLESTSGTPGVDFSMEATRPPDGDYVFGSGADPFNFFANAFTAGPIAILAISDFLDDPLGSVDVPPAPSLIARVTIHTSANVGDLKIGFDFVDLGDPAGGIIPAMTFGDGTIPAIPEPSTWLLALLAFGALFVGRRSRCA
jgi:hypothetical protein